MRALIASVAVTALLWIVLPAVASGQRYDNWMGDTTFTLGAHGISNYIPYVRDTLHFDFIQNYNGPTSLAYLDTTHPGTLDYSYWWTFQHDSAYFHALGRSHGLRTIFAPGVIADIGTELRVTENYFGHANVPWIHLQRFDYPDTMWSSHPATDYVPMNNTFLFGVRARGKGSRSDTLVARQSKASTEALYVPSGSIYLRVGLDTAALLHFWDITLGVSINSDSLNRTINPIPDTATVVYADLYAQDTTGQSICKCNFYRHFIRLNVHKADYLDSAIAIQNSVFRDIPLTFQFPTIPDTISRAIVVMKGAVPITAVSANQILHPYIPSQADIGDGDQDADCLGYCHALFDSLKAVGHFKSGDTVLSHAVSGSEFYVNVGLTRIVETTFLKSTISPRLYTLIRNGIYDTQINNVVNAINGDPWLDSLFLRYGIIDEPVSYKYAGYRELAQKIQNRQEAIGDARELWANPEGDHSTFRITSGDLDSLGSRRKVFMLAEQEYNVGGAIPVTYANPDSMSITARDTSYLQRIHDVISGSDTTRNRYIMGNSAPDYSWYTAVRQATWSGKIGQILEAVNASRYRFRLLDAPSVPVYYVSQVHGKAGDGNTWESGWRPTTPEEITVQPWLALSCGVEGIVFSDFQYQGNEFGLMHWNSQDSLGWADSTLTPPERGRTFYDRYWNAEYDIVYSGHPNDYRQGRHTPKTWCGFGSRRRAVERVADTLYNWIIPVYKKLRHDPVRMSVNDTSASFATFPVVDSLVAERASQYVDTGFVATASYDSRAQTYMDLAAFQPGKYMPDEAADGTLYCLVINKRCWPIDFHHYSVAETRLLDTVAGTLATNRHDTVGLGNIDVRRPVVWLRNTSTVLADSLLVTNLADTSWHRRVAVGDSLTLEWLPPGWGAMYKITPIPSGISPNGAAYNNAVRAENPSTDGAESDRVMVYERDSLIWIRAMDSAGRWSAERMVTDTGAFAARVSGSRRYYDLNPAVALSRGDGSALVVWERRDMQALTSTVQCLHNPAHPTVAALNDAGWDIGAARYALSQPYAPFGTWRELTPAVVAVESDGVLDAGYVAAWSGNDGIDLCAVRDMPDVPGSAAAHDTLHLTGVHMDSTAYGHAISSSALFPTLAYVSNLGSLYDTEIQAGIPAGADSIERASYLALPQKVLHLSYQQATTGSHYRIMYNRIGVRFEQTMPLVLSAAPTEEVTAGLAGCSFIHPSIATDSVRLGVAFEVSDVSNGIILRFRDTLTTGDTLRSVHAWRTPLYSWGGTLSATYAPFTTGRDYQWPSLTEFPSFPEDSTRQVLDGGLVWQWMNAPGGRHYPLVTYRYGNFAADTLSEAGRWPTMMLVPGRRTAPFVASGIFHRGADADSIAGVSAFGVATRYFPAMMVNTPSLRSSIFVAAQQSRSVHSQFWLGPSDKTHWYGFSCATGGQGIAANPSIRMGIHTGGGGISAPLADSLWWQPIDETPLSVPKLPPSFFDPPVGGRTRVETLAAAAEVARTSTFHADASSVPLVRTVVGSDSLVAWLDEFPYDSSMHSSADFKILTELVRASDSVVLWRDDTISARSIAAGYDEGTVTVPLSGYASPGDLVFIRLRVVPTQGLDSFDVAAGFHFVDSTSGGYLKMTHPYDAVAGHASPGSGLSAVVAPNPVRSAAEIKLRIPEAGTARVAVYGETGLLVESLPSLDVARAGEYTLELDTGGLPVGVYTVRVSMERAVAIARFTVLR